MTLPLLTTKLYKPIIRSEFVSRPRLIEHLNRGLRRKLTLVSAAAGFGKTMLVSDWLRQVELPVVWLSLDETDNDPLHFLNYVMAALRQLDLRLNQTRQTLAQLNARPNETPETLITTAIINELNTFATTAAGLILVLDDYHLIEAEAIHHGLAFLLEYWPPQLHLVLISRTDPPLPLARLRAEGQLLELRTADLRFTPEETATFLNQVMGLGLSPADLTALEARTEGWITGLQLAALSMQDELDVPGFIDHFSGSHRYVLDYLASEVLQRQPESIQQFLLQTAILNRLCGPLGEAVTGQTNGQVTLAMLDQANLFLIPLDDERRWYRYHSLFADFLRQRLQSQLDGPGINALHRRAAAWFQQNDLVAEAMGHALAAADVDRAAKLLEQSSQIKLRQSEIAVLISWLQALPAELVRDRPRLSLFHTWGSLFTGQLDTVEAQLQAAKDVLGEVEEERFNQIIGKRQPDLRGEITAIAATVAYFRRDLPRAIQLYCRAFEQLAEENLFLRGAVALSLATAYTLNNNLERGKWAFTQAAAISQANENHHLALVALQNLAQLHLEQAELHRAAELQRQALALASQQKTLSSVSAMIGRFHIGLGEVLYQWNDLAGAEPEILAGLEWGRRSGDAMTLMSAYLALARLRYHQAGFDRAAELIRQAERLEHEKDLSSWRDRLTAAWVWLWFSEGDLAAITNWPHQDRPKLPHLGSDDSAGYPSDLHYVRLITQVRLLLAQTAGSNLARQAKLTEADTLLKKLHREAELAHRLRWLIEILALQALTYQTQGEAEPALLCLGRALSLAEPAGYVRLFVDEGPPMAALLQQAARHQLAPAYVSKLLSAFSVEAARSGSDLIEPLSERELEILTHLARGMSNRQIADALSLSVGTVKWHLNNIYGKLGVSRRTQAVAQARDLGLID